MKKYIEIQEEVIARLVLGKCVEGSLHRDVWTGKVTFRAYQRHPRTRMKDKMVRKLPWGWVKESIERIKVYGSFPKDMGTVQMMGLLEEHAHDAREALIDREIIEFC